MGSIPRSRSEKRAHTKGDESLFTGVIPEIGARGEDVLSFVSLQPPESEPLLPDTLLSACSSASEYRTEIPRDVNADELAMPRLPADADCVATKSADDIGLDELPMPRLGKKRRAVARREERRSRDSGAYDQPVTRTSPSPRDLPTGTAKTKKMIAEPPRLRGASVQLNRSEAIPVAPNETVLDYLIKSIARVLERLHRRLVTKNTKQAVAQQQPEREPLSNLKKPSKRKRGLPGDGDKKN